MAENLSKIRGQLKAQWVEANRRVLELRRKVAEAEQKAAALQRVLDAVEKAAPPTADVEEPVARRTYRNSVQTRIVAVLKDKGALDPREIAAETGASYWSVLTHLKNGPFRQQPRLPGEGKAARKWALVMGEGDSADILAGVGGKAGEGTE